MTEVLTQHKRELNTTEACIQIMVKRVNCKSFTIKKHGNF